MKPKAWYRGASASLIITFILGVGVGFGLCYATLELMREETLDDREVVITSAPETPDIDQVPVETTPDEEPLTSALPPQPETTQPETTETEKEGEIKITVEPANPKDVWPARHLIVGFNGTALENEELALIRRYMPGGIWLREENVLNAKQIAGLIKRIHSLFDTDGLAEMKPLVFFAPETSLDNNPLDLKTPLSYAQIAELDSFEAIKQAGFDTARAALAVGIDVLLAPSLDIFNEAESAPELRRLCFGATPETVAQAGLTYAEGLMEGGIIAVAKHYPGAGATILQKDGILLLAETDVNALASIMMPFMEAAVHDIHALMVSAITVPTLDVSAPGRPAFFSPILVREALRNQWGFEGLIISDDILDAANWSLTPVEKDIAVSYTHLTLPTKRIV